MINNQIQSPVTGKNSVMSGQGTEESKRGAGKQQGGLFKLLMNSMQAGDQTGKKGNSAAANILGGNITLNNSKEGESKQSALHLLTGSGEGSKEEKITLSKLLEGSGSTVESTGDKGSNEELNAEAATDVDENTSESTDGTVVSEDESTGGEEQTDVEAAKLPADDSQQAALEPDGIKDDNTVQAGKTDSNTEGQKPALMAGNIAGEQAAPSGKIDAQQQATALSGESVTVGSGSLGLSQQAAALSGEAVTATSTSGSQVSNVQATVGDTKESNALNGLIADQETAEKDKQTGIGALFTGEKVAEGEGLSDGRGRRNGNSVVRPELVKSEGLVNELRALAAAQGEQLMAGQQQRRVPTEQLNEVADSGASEDGAFIQEIFSALQNGSIEQVAAEIRSLKASQLRETKYSNYMSSFADRQEISNGGSALSSGSGSSTSYASSDSTATMMPVSAMVPTGASVSSEMFDENGAVLWKEQITEYFESNEKSASENQAAAAFARLGEVPVTNISVRRSFAQGISRAIIHSTGEGKKGSEVWQKHNFILEDGKNIQVSAREVEGVLHLKLSSSYTELNKLLMNHENEIRDLLENELELKIDLQMDGGDGNAADLFGGSSGQQSDNGNGPLDLGSLKKTTEQKVEEVVPKAVRKFGYNQMEWTV